MLRKTLRLRSLALLLLLLLLGSCRKKYGKVAQDVGAKVPGNTAYVLPDAQPTEGPTDTLLTVSVRVNGAPPYAWMGCSIVVFDQESSASTRGKGECGQPIRLEPGNADVVAYVRAGELQTFERLQTRNFAAGPNAAVVDVRWDVGRVRIKRNAHKDVASCRVTADGVAGDLEQWAVAKAGSYQAHFACEDLKGKAFAVDVKFAVATNTDNEVAVTITPGQDSTSVRTIEAPPPPPPTAPSSSEQFPVTKEYTVVPPTPGRDLPEPAGTPLSPPQTPTLAEPKGQDLAPSERVNP